MVTTLNRAGKDTSLKRRLEDFLLHAHPKVINYSCVKFHQYLYIWLGEVMLTRNMDRQTDKRTC